MNNVNYSENTNTTHYCGCCKRELPLDAFYFNTKKQRPDRYCKECRKASSRKQHRSDKYKQNVDISKEYPVITQIQDPEMRKQLILHALQVVEESIARKRKKEREQEEAFNI